VTVAGPTFDLVVAANRLPVERVLDASGRGIWQRSPGGLVTALESVMTGRNAAWAGWAGVPGPASEPFHQDGLFLRPVSLSSTEIAEYYEGFSNKTLWPIYHDVIVPASFHRNWWNTYRTVNHRFAQAIAQVAAPGGTVWVHDYQLQLVPAMLRSIRPDVRIGWFNHIPFPPVELFAQLPWRRALVEGLVGADFLGFQRAADAENFLRVCRRLLGMSTMGDTVTFTPPGDEPARRTVRASAIPISVDLQGAQRPGAHPGGPRPRGRDPCLPGRPRDPPAGRRPARLHQGDPAPAQGLRRTATRQDHRPTPGDAHASRLAEPRAGGGLPSSARGGRAHGRTDQRRVLRPGLSRHPLPAPLLPACRDGGDVRGRRHPAGDAATRRDEPHRQGVRRQSQRPRWSPWCCPSSPAPGTSCTRPSSATLTTSRASNRRSCARSPPPRTNGIVE